MVSIIFLVIVFLFFIAICAIGYALFIHYIEEIEKTDEKPNAPIKKMEYDCTENFYHD